jgi:hypothetical protein
MQLTESEGLKAMCNMNAAVSFICIGDSDSSSQVVFHPMLLPCLHCCTLSNRYALL